MIEFLPDGTTQRCSVLLYDGRQCSSPLLGSDGNPHKGVHHSADKQVTPLQPMERLDNRVGDLMAEMGNVRAEIDEMRGEINDLRTEVAAISDNKPTPQAAEGGIL